ncbi:protein NRT1/ PTR FAMILY 5.3-like [Cryptomeria japonica]|uniref:protein NRT1/ PTR FAMILY 5.3-like n=1 Tax=Cryptomeria japonica TaxID=3369 RepID=UPI0027DA4549|nr:protein NRT1/ PTR FAMILY 5.3-like [Cryptomeria japonica]
MDTRGNLGGRSYIRLKTGGWKAASLIIGYEFCERMAFAGIWSNLVVYLTTKLHEGTVSSSTNASNWIGTSFLTPLLGAYIADTYFGHFFTFLIFSCIYSLGMVFLTLVILLKPWRPPDCPTNEGCQKVSSLTYGTFYIALYFVALGSGGARTTISAFGSDQFGDSDPEESQQKITFFNWWVFIVFFGGLIGQTFVVYVEDQISWGIGFGIITLALVPSDPSFLHEVDSREYVAQYRQLISHTSHLRLLDKAAVQNGATSNPCTVTDVEETKIVVQILKLWVTAIFPSTLQIQSGTLFLRQAMTLETKMGFNFQFPQASIGAFVPIAMLLSLLVYNHLLVPILRRFTGNQQGITIVQRMGAGMLIHTLAMLTAMVTEIERLNAVKKHGVADNMHAIVPRNIFTLLPQFMLMGIAAAFLQVGKLEFFYDEAPESIQSLGSALYAASLGVGAFINSILLKVVSSITGRVAHESWILDNVNASRLDLYYALLAFLNSLNYIFFCIMSHLYRLKRKETEPSVNVSMNVENLGNDINTDDGIQRGL